MSAPEFSAFALLLVVISFIGLIISYRVGFGSIIQKSLFGNKPNGE